MKANECRPENHKIFEGNSHMEVHSTHRMDAPVNPKLKNSQSGAIIEVNSNPFSIGRGLSCNFVIPSKTVSRVHCVLEKNEGSWILVDTSTNGSFVNGRLIKGAKSPPLKDGDVIATSLDVDSYVFKSDTAVRMDDISDEQLCDFADSVLQEVEIFQRETESEQFPLENTSNAVSSSEALHDHLDMAKRCEYQPTKKRKTTTGTVVEEPSSTNTNLVDLAEITTSLVRKVDDLLSQEPGSSTDKPAPAEEIPQSSVVTPENPAQPPENVTDLQREQYEVMENELQCAICSELFVKAVTLNCSHTFCKYCIEMWKKNKLECPICRTRITGTTATLVLDNVIDKVIEGSAEDIKQHRKQLLEDRKAIEEAVKPPAENTRSRGRGRRGRGGGGRTTPSEAPRLNVLDPAAINIGALINNNVIEVSSDSNSDSESSGTHSDDTNEWRDDYDNDEWYDDGIPGAYYGGYGRCYICGRGGHWANGCPYR